MLNLLGDGAAHDCDGSTRRDFLTVGALSALGLSLADMAAAAEAGAVKPGHEDKACILIFNLGAPSAQDCFDPKPDAPKEIRGPFKAVSTKGDFLLSEILPEHAKLADRFSMVRSCHHTAPAVHDTGLQMMQTGRLFTGGVNSPHAGSVLSYLRGRKSDLPASVILPERMGAVGGNLPNGQDAGFLGRGHDPFILNADPSQPNFKVPDLLPPASISDARLERRRKLRSIVEGHAAAFESSDQARLMDSNFESAYRLITSPQARGAFDLNQEPDSVRDRYGRNRFGASLLLARRLIEAGVRFVTVNTFLTVFNEITWDIHGTNPFTSIEGMRDVVAPMYDQAYSALMTDLIDRGMLDDTLVCNLAEFGRTPRVNPAGGRDHWPQCWTMYFAGGGVQGGRAVGASDEIGAYPAERPTTPADVVGTIFHSLGLDLHTELPGPAGRPFPLVDFGTKPLYELFA
ncbi:DUF1501 domain-containing protein [Alienimonas californiensis]|uniref:Sulfatase n=1 Tax=Alienimonas californiensis TaxID=2527989 RepID=A0A517P9H6_9PLAN|nr:DUF1501 domain-containing protein [Alienimonas californiensis]QDT16024.1 hypothetical protein CA12_21220 [Alienimonas californiensis]